MKIMNNITYRQAGDYLLPNLTLPESEMKVSLGRYGMMHKKFLKENKKLMYNKLMISGTLMSHCKKVEDEAKERFTTLISQMARAQGVTEELKAIDQMKWVGMSNNIRQAAEEIVLSELIYN